MARLHEHPTARRYQERLRAKGDEAAEENSRPLDAVWLRNLCLNAGADDVGFVELGREELADQRSDILSAFPRTRTLISFVQRMNRGPIRSPARSVANLEFHRTVDETNDVAHRIVAALEQHGISAINPAAGFPMEMDRYPEKMWTISHKPVAVAAGLGHMGIHRNVIHPRFGNFILLGTVLIDAEVTRHGAAIDYNPCLECKLCVAVCPVGAIGADGTFNFAACMTHNYREFMVGFSDWVGTVADSRDGADYRRKVTDSETASMWQSLSFGANYKAAYCLAVCPAGEDVIGPFLRDRKSFIKEIVQPLQEKSEPVYVRPGSDAEAYVARRFPQKTIRRVRAKLRAASIEALFRRGLSLNFQRRAARQLEMNATFHFHFTGEEPGAWTVVIRDQTLQVSARLEGTPDVQVFADSRVWLEFVNGERRLLPALLRRQIRVRGTVRLLMAFGRCFA